MKVLILAVVLAFCLSPLAVRAQDETMAEKMNLRGPVKKVTAYYLVPEETGGKQTVKKVISDETSFNRKGQMTERLTYSSGDLPVKQVNIFDAQGRMILYENYGGFHRPDPNGPTEWSDEYVYKRDPSGRIVEQTKVSKYGGNRLPATRIVLRYDSRGNVIESSQYIMRDNAPYERNVFTYDAKNRRTGTEKYNYSGELESRSSRILNPEGRVIEETFTGKHHKNAIKMVYQYDQKGRLISREAVDTVQNKQADREAHVYNDTELTEEVLIYYGGVLYTKTVKQLDQYGNLRAKVETMSDEAKKLMAEIAKQPSTGMIPFEAGAIAALSGMFAREAFKHEYDARGNWIKRIEYQATEFVIGQDNLDAELKPVRTQLRTVEYYDR